VPLSVGNRSRRAILTLAATLIGGPWQPGAAQSQTVDERIKRIESSLIPIINVGGAVGPFSLEERMAYYGVPGISVAVINDYRIEWAKGYGLRDADRNQPVDTATLFQAASVSKPVSALASLKLVENGTLSLDADVNDWMVSWKVPKSEIIPDHHVTLRGMLSHTAGLTPTGYSGYAPGTKVPKLLQVLNGTRPANTSPILVDQLNGQGFHYSGGGYTILQQLAIDVTHRDYAGWMAETVLRPLDMVHSTYEQPLPKKFRKNAASGHRSSGRPLRGKYHTYPEMAAAGLWTTPSDLARFALEIQSAAAGRSSRVVGQELLTDMLTPQRGGPVGLGLFLRGSGGAIRFGHSGANEGYRCEFLAFVHRGQGAVVMTNSDTGGGLLSEIINSIATEYDWPDYSPDNRPLAVDPRVYGRYVGDYEVSPEVVFSVVREGDRLFINSPGIDRAPLFLESETDFFLTMAEQRIGFVVDGQGGVTGLILREGGHETRAVKRR
jgi:CubicO group peptidase (beta-lactamase class C family)